MKKVLPLVALLAAWALVLTWCNKTENVEEVVEETGAVETMLEKVAQYYEEQVEITTANLTTLMEPMIIVVLGGIVGVLVMAMYMPMINMMSGLENL